MATEPRQVVAVLLAGGLARRMGGGDKCLLPLGGRPLLAHVLERIRPQVGAVVLNANGDPARLAAFAVPVVPDAIEGFAGPLAGILTGLEWTRATWPAATHVVSVATDTPFLPRDLVARFLAAVGTDPAALACASSAGRSHPVFGLWPVALAAELRRALVEEGVRKIDRWTARRRLIEVPFAVGAVDPFFNLNRPEDLAEAGRLLAAAPS
jgi:molybdopterin-guanine dinucleotide biosynthesis protein A